MKGLILSGGKGTRLRPLTYTSAKQLIPVANKPILFYGIEAMKEAGITDIGIVVGDTKREIMDAVNDGSKWGVKVTYIEQDYPKGLAHAVQISENFIKDEPFVMYLGDNLIKSGVSGLVKEFKTGEQNSIILLVKVKDPTIFGVAELKDDVVVGLEEKPKKPKSDFALAGVYLFDKNIFEAVKHIKPSFRNELEITDAIQWLIDNKYSVKSHKVVGWWKDTGKIEDMLEANRTVLDGLNSDVKGEVSSDSDVDFKVIIEKGAKIIASTVRGPAIIGKNTVIRNSYVGPFTSISDNCLIENSEIEHSIVWGNSKITDIAGRISDSLVGRGAEIKKVEKKPKAYKFLISDSSLIEIS